jgi:hydroxyethylthiazole kinase-like uncharacterized protein yjeF
MLPLLTSSQIREADAYTIAHESISSIGLMERAATAFVGWFANHFPDKDKSISVYCGTGNNGGDGLAIARLLNDQGYEAINVKIAGFSGKYANGFNINLERVRETMIPVSTIGSGENFPAEDADILIVALLGTGLNKPLEGNFKKLVTHINSLGRTVVSVDVPAGLFSEGEIPQDALILKADFVVTFQAPKINFLLPESAPYIKKWEAVDIGIDKYFIHSLESPYQAIEENDIRKMLKPRHRFSNKGTYGHALIIAGQAETMGAALLSAAGCAYAGSGLTTACIPAGGLTALNSYMPEVMAIVRTGVSLPKIEWNKFNAIGIGPGLGKEKDALELLTNVLSNYEKPLLMDADALNLLSKHTGLWQDISENSILTPHVKEFDRLFGEHTSWWQRIQTGIEEARKHRVYILLKNDYTLIITPVGKVYFNTTSNPAMATGGMGDVLTGIITSLLAQKYSPEDACLVGAFIHGRAGDELALPNRMNVVLPGQLAAYLPIAMAKLMA